MEPLQLLVHGTQLITDGLAVIQTFKREQHGFHLALAIDQHAALGGSGLVGHEVQ